MLRYLGPKFLRLGIVVIAVSALTYVMTDLLPGDPVITILGPTATEESAAKLREELGYDRPLPARYLSWATDAAQGDLGSSPRTNQKVTEALSDRLPVSLELMVLAQLMALGLAIPMGIIAAWRAGGWFDRISTALGFALLAVPSFLAGILLIYLFALRWDMFDATGYTKISEDLKENLRSLFLPALTLAITEFATYLRLLRSEVISTLNEDYILLARAKGLPTWRILFRHALRPSSLPLVTVAGINVGRMIGGAVVVESLFSLPGVGRYLVDSIQGGDFLMVQGIVVVIAVGYVVVNFAVDILYSVLDPRIRRAAPAL